MVKILHGRRRYSDLGVGSDALLAKLGRLINKTLGPRVLVHEFGIISGHGPRCIPLREQHGEERELIYKELPPRRFGYLRRFLGRAP